MPRIADLAASIAAFMAVATSAGADVTISSDPTQNMSCSNGVCTPTARDAVLNVSDLENLLAPSSVTVTTTGSGVQAANIEVKGEFGWSSANTLFLDAFQSITVGRVISIAGTGGLVLRTKDGGSGGALTFVRKVMRFFTILPASSR